MHTDIMIDLETMSSDSHAAIIAIGAIKFDRHGHTPIPTPPHPNDIKIMSVETLEWFYCNVDLGSSMRAGGHVDPKTVMWWCEQSEIARDAIRSPKPMDIKLALDLFTRWVGGQDTPVRVWSHATFDFPIIANAYQSIDKRMPFRYPYARDVRTIYDTAYPDTLVPGVTDAHKHHALWDAYRQAQGVQHCFMRLRGIDIDPNWLAKQAQAAGIRPGETFSVVPGVETLQQSDGPF